VTEAEGSSNSIEEPRPTGNTVPEFTQSQMDAARDDAVTIFLGAQLESCSNRYLVTYREI